MSLDSRFLTPASRWSALTVRDPESNNKFVYCVKTTRIYCRPVCKARLARRANVEFHNTPAEAEAAGYRPCKRCKPELMEGEDVEEREIQRRIERAKQRVLNGEDVVLEELAKEAGWSKWHFARVFKKIVGLSPRELRDQLRAERQPEQEVAGPSASGDVEMGPSPPYDVDWATLEGLDMLPDETPLPQMLPDFESAYPGFDDEAFLHEVSPLNPVLADLFPEENFGLVTVEPNVISGSRGLNEKATNDYFDFNALSSLDYSCYDSSVPSLFDGSADSVSSAPITTFSSPKDGFATPFELEYALDSFSMPTMTNIYPVS